MIHRITSVLFFLVCLVSPGHAQTLQNKILFDDNWKFLLGDTNNAEKPLFNDKVWRDIDLLHDWSIERLPNQDPDR